MKDAPPSQAARGLQRRVQEFVAEQGRAAAIILVGGAAAVLGTVIPFAYVSGLFGGQYYSLVQSGVYGVVLIAISVFLTVFPIMLKQYARFTLASFGLACAIFGIFFAIWLASSGFVGTLGLGGFAIGFYLELLGYGALVIGYYELQRRSSNTTI